jgi:N-acetylneuraminic acid mutarotase
VGGLTAGKAHNAVLKFDAEHDSWSELAPLHFARTNAGVCAVGGKLYVVGGHSESLLDSVERYDEVSNTWTSVAPLPMATDSMRLFCSNKKLYCGVCT